MQALLLCTLDRPTHPQILSKTTSSLGELTARAERNKKEALAAKPWLLSVQKLDQAAGYIPVGHQEGACLNTWAANC